MAPVIVKKPVSTTPTSSEIVVEPIQASSVIVIHPGSMYLRIGRASEAFPKVLPHVIARRNKLGAIPVHKDDYLVPIANMPSELIASLDEIQSAISAVLASCLTREGRLRYSVPLHIVSEFNSRARPYDICTKSDLCWTKVEEEQNFVIGDEALYLKPNENFNIHWPIRKGQLNLHSGVGGSLSSVLADLEAIWGTAIEKILDIPLKDLKVNNGFFSFNPLSGIDGKARPSFAVTTLAKTSKHVMGMIPKFEMIA